MKKYRIPVSWAVSSEIEVRAQSLAEAVRKANDAPLPRKNVEYIDGSFSVDFEMIRDANKGLAEDKVEDAKRN